MAEAYPTQNIDKAAFDIISRLLTPNAADSSSAGNALGPATLKQLGNAGQNVSDAIGPYQQGVAKALKDFGQQHVQQAIAQGADPINDIQNHSIMKNNGDMNGNIITPQHIVTMASLLNSMSNGGQNQQPVITPIQQRAQDIVAKQSGFMGNFSQAYNDLIGLSGTQLDNLSKAQAISNQGAAQQSELASAGYSKALSSQVQQKMAGKEPLQPADVATIRGGLNKLSLDALTATSDKIEHDIEQARQIADSHQKTLNLVGKVGGWFSGNGQTLAKGTQESLDYIKQLQTAKAKVDARITTFNPINPLTGNPVNNSPSNAQYSGITKEMALKELAGRKK